MDFIDKANMRIIDTVDTKGNPIKLQLKEPDYEITRLCDVEYKKAWTFCFQEGVKTHDRLQKMFLDQGEWTEDHDRQLNELNVNIAVKTVLLEKCNMKGRLDTAKQLALEIMELRNQAMTLSQLKQQPFQYSCENSANEIRMEAYIAYATVYADDEDSRFFKNYKDFTERREEKASLDVYNAYLQIVLQENSDFIRNLPENSFLMEQGFIDKDMKMIKQQPKIKKKVTSKK